MGIQYPVTPLLITEHQWQISGIETPVIDQQIFEVLEEPFVWYESPIVVEPEKNIVCNHRVVGGAANFGNSTIAGAEKWRVIGSVVGQHHEAFLLTWNSKPTQERRTQDILIRIASLNITALDICNQRQWTRIHSSSNCKEQDCRTRDTPSHPTTGRGHTCSSSFTSVAKIQENCAQRLQS